MPLLPCVSSSVSRATAIARASLLCCIVLLFILSATKASSDKKPHGHRGILTPFDGNQIPYSITQKESELLDQGKPVVYSDKDSGRALVIQDIHAPTTVCMEKIMDVKNYHKYVSQVQSVAVYNEKRHTNGTVSTWARFDVAALAMGFRYWLALTYQPAYATYTWTLDYNFESDFDDNVGHWQVMEHPTKRGWSRVLYSCHLRLFSWIPSFIVTYMIKTALVESTTWVAKESHKSFSVMSANDKLVLSQKKSTLKLKPCYVYDGSGFKYYIEKSWKKCGPGPIFTEVNVHENGNILNNNAETIVDFITDGGNLWALAIAVLCAIVALSPRFISTH